MIINFGFVQYFLLELKDFILSKYFVTFYDNFKSLWYNTASLKILRENNYLPSMIFYY